MLFRWVINSVNSQHWIEGREYNCILFFISCLMMFERVGVYVYTCLLAVPRSNTVFGSRAFRVAAPTVFNSLPQDIRSCDNISTFCRRLKTFYFRNAFIEH